MESAPDTWVTVYTDDIGSTFGPKGFCNGFEPARLVAEVSDIIVHKADEPNALVGLFDSDGLPGMRTSASGVKLAVTCGAAFCAARVRHNMD
jgi:hypothetical protein